MAINRGPWNALVDDDGSNLIGSIWNKDAIKTVLLDPMDAALAGVSSVDTIVTSTATGTVNDWAPGLVGHTTIVWTGTAALTITGIAGGVNGQRVTIKNRGTAAISLAHGSAGSGAANRLGNMATSAATPIAPGGFATYVYQNTVGWLLLAHEQGAWITPAYAAADYTSQSGTWTVESADVAVAQSYLFGRSLAFLLSINTSTLTVASSTALRRPLFGGFSAQKPISGVMAALNATPSLALWNLTGSQFNFYRDITATSWAIGSIDLYVNGTIEVV